jgi:hypothetical protein
MTRFFMVLFAIPAIPAAFIVSPWTPNPKGKNQNIIFGVALAYSLLYFIVFHFCLKAF